MKQLLVIAVVCICIAFVSGRVNTRSLHHHLEKYFDYYQAQHVDDPPPFQWFTQPLNHFDEQDQRSWEQRYVVNTQYWNGTGPVFYMINGEGPLSQYSVVALQYCIWAQEFNALLISLEHRYYGESQPTKDLSTNNLKYLTADQALADAANFRQFIANKYDAHNSMFITFGGSYAGELSGWMRIKYPHLIDASVASSGPVNAEVDFYQYLEVISASLTTLGSASCVQNIAAATQKIQALTTSTTGLNTLATYFNTCAAIEPEDIPNFMQSLAGNFMGTVQYNLEFPGVNITTLCNMMTNSNQDPLTNYLAVWNTFANGECVDVSYKDMIFELQNTSIFTGVAGRQWFYQTCVEFGYFQTSDSLKQPFGDLFNVSTQTQQCKDVFGFDFLPDVNWTLTEYGGNQPEGSDIIWVNGSIDPWHALGVLVTPPGAHYNTLLINGTAHCADMMLPFSGAPSTLPGAQEVIRAQLATWITNGKQ